MKPKLAIVFLLIVLLPLALVGWLGYRTARNEQEAVQRRFRELLTNRLADVRARITDYLQEVERNLIQLTDLSETDEETLREMTRREALADHAFLLSPTGELVFPYRKRPASESEQAFLVRTDRIWKDREIERTRAAESGLTGAMQVPISQQAAEPRKDWGWFVWFWDEGLHLLFWQRNHGGWIVGVEVNRMRLLSELIGKLPPSGAEAGETEEGRVILSGLKGETLYQWGAFTPEREQPLSEQPLDFPLSSWRLAYYVPPGMAVANGGQPIFSLLAGLAALGAALIGLAVYFARESGRELREAAQRISFVNQVSHELKTPLTNIRMYAELLEGEIGEEEDRVRGKLGVIHEESARLSRLIGNILTFSRQQRSKLSIHLAPGVIDEVIRIVGAHFEPIFTAKGVRVDSQLTAPNLVLLDRDVVEQILGNLFSNVEKYASGGGRLRVTSQQSKGKTLIRVMDEGPGIPWGEREKVFAPFYRLSDRLADGVAGTGIGLSISRDLARLHGGDLRLQKTDTGACFELEIKTPEAEA